MYVAAEMVTSVPVFVIARGLATAAVNALESNVTAPITDAAPVRAVVPKTEATFATVLSVVV